MSEGSRRAVLLAAGDVLLYCVGGIVVCCFSLSFANIAKAGPVALVVDSAGLLSFTAVCRQGSACVLPGAAL